MVFLRHAGCGKSTVIKEIHKVLTQSKKICQIVCPTGVACKIYDQQAATVHSFYGLQNAELPVPLLLDRALKRDDIVDQIRSVDVLIWDEISMVSVRIFHIVDQLHQKVRENSLPFGGIQVVLGGDFFQLKPIESMLDSGDPVFKSAIFDKVFPHRVILETVLRQDEAERKFKSALDDLRFGVCDDETEEYIRGLSRCCVNSSPSVHVFFKRLPVDVYNSYMLSCLSDEMLKYESIDTGCTGLMKGVVPKILTLKRGCEVMLLFNINNSLTNGTRGKFIDVDSSNESLLVNFPNVGVVAVSQKTWFVYSKNGHVKATRTQFPLTLSYAITVHKTQSATLESAVIHCSQEFDSGQTYVALSIVRSEENTQVIGFQKRFLLKQPAHLSKLHTAQEGNPVSSFNCCRNVELEYQNCELDREHLARDDVSNSPAVDEDITVIEEKCKTFFATHQGEKEDFAQILATTPHCNEPSEHSINCPPSQFAVKDFLKSITKDMSTDSLSQLVKEAARYGLENLELFELLTRILWCRIVQLFDGYVRNNTDTIHMSSYNFTQVTTHVNQMFLTNEYRSDIVTVFNLQSWSETDSGQRTLAAQLLFHLYQMCIAEISKSVVSNEHLQSNFQNVSGMSPDGRGKIRYIEGSATRKLLENCRRYVIENKNSASKEVIGSVSKEMKKIDLLENHVIVSSESVHETSEIPETLQVTDWRQYRERGFLNISDTAHEFFMLLEQERINQINLHRLTQLGTDLISDSIASVTKNEAVQNRFHSLFCLDDAEQRVSLRT